MTTPNNVFVPLLLRPLISAVCILWVATACATPVARLAEPKTSFPSVHIVGNKDFTCKASEIQSCEADCASEGGLACLKLANSLFFGLGIEKDYPHALEMYGKACENDQIDACGVAALIYIEENGALIVDPRKALRWYGIACEAGDPEYCSRLGHQYLNRKWSPANEEKGLSLLDKACEMGVEQACRSALGYRQNVLGLKVENR